MVLDDALSLALPTTLGQHLSVKEYKNSTSESLLWKSYTSDGDCWFEGIFQKSKNYSTSVSLVYPRSGNMGSQDIANKLIQILNKACMLNPNFLSGGAYEVETKLDFDRNWGLGSSSTLICNIAKWAEVDAFELSQASFGGSGYDIAVGMLGGDILYRNSQLWEGFVFNPSFQSQLYFVHLNQKQDSRSGIHMYREKEVSKQTVTSISTITEKMILCTDFKEFQKLVVEHERIIASVIEKEPIKQVLFSDYPYAIKSLGAWGGDFILVCGDEQTPGYFDQRGYKTVLSYQELIKK